MTLEEALPYILAAISIFSFIAGRVSAGKKEGERDGTMMAEMGYVKANTDDIKQQMREHDQKYLEMVTRQTATEESVKQAHHRIDEIREHCCGD